VLVARTPGCVIAGVARGGGGGLRLGGWRRSFPVDAGSRERTGELLGGLRDGRWRPSAWCRFAGRATVMSWQAAAARPRAAAEVTVLHAAMAGLARHGGGGSPAWAVASWLGSVTHLGLLGQRGSLGAANVITLARANLPALGSGRWTGPAALAADVLDGWLARRRGEVTVFGSYADTIADAAFWTWFAARHEPSRRLRAVAYAAWGAPPAAAAALSLARGAMTGPPRHELLCPAAPLAVLLVIRANACGGPGENARRTSGPEHDPAAAGQPHRDDTAEQEA
jgi:CDP-alcohol phosphatidyltransferase-like enzyme